MSRPAERTGPPDAGLVHAHLDDLRRRVSVETVDELWIFPTRRLGGIDSTVFVVSAFDDDGDRRRVLTIHYTVRRSARGAASVEHTLVEHGSAPADRIGRLVEGVLRRLDESCLDAPPHPARISGEPDRWIELLESFATGTEPDAGPADPPAPDGRG